MTVWILLKISQISGELVQIEFTLCMLETWLQISALNGFSKQPGTNHEQCSKSTC